MYTESIEQIGDRFGHRPAPAKAPRTTGGGKAKPASAPAAAAAFAGFDLSQSKGPARTSPAPGSRAASAPAASGFDLSLTSPRRNDDKPPIVLPFQLYIDDRERRAGWTFTGMYGDSSDDYRQLVVATQVVRLDTGDYAIVGWEDRICVERKSIDDLYSSCTHGRHRFEAEHRCMQDMIVRLGGAAWVVIEGSFDDEPTDSGAAPSAIRSTCLAWQERYGVPWVWAGSRFLAQQTALGLLRKAHRRVCKAAPEWCI